MNFIICDQRCRHQEEGYCTLNQIAQLSNDISAKCGYFEANDITKPSSSDLQQHKGLTQNIQRLG